LEVVFRLFLASGNRPLDVKELGKELREKLGGDTYRTSVEMMAHLLKRDPYYGLRPLRD